MAELKDKQDEAPKIKVKIGKDDPREFDFSEGMTAGDALKLAGQSKVPAKSTLSVSGNKARPGDKLAPGALVVLTPNVGNGAS